MSKVSLIIFNLLGEEVATFVNEEKSSRKLYGRVQCIVNIRLRFRQRRIPLWRIFLSVERRFIYPNKEDVIAKVVRKQNSQGQDVVSPNFKNLFIGGVMKKIRKTKNHIVRNLQGQSFCYLSQP